MTKQVTRFFSFSLCLSLLLCAAVGSATAASFHDVGTTAWYYDAVDYASDEGLFSGTGSGNFSPDATMTRGMFVTVLGRLAGANGSAAAAAAPFVVVEASDYFAPHADWAYETGITNGVGGAFLFGPHYDITRQELVTMLQRYVESIGGDSEHEDIRTYQSYDDHSKVDMYAIDKMSWALEKGIIRGKEGNRLDPQGFATRAEAAQIFLNAKDILAGGTGEETPEPPVTVDADLAMSVEAVDEAVTAVLETERTIGDTKAALGTALETLEESGYLSGLG